MRYTLLTVMVLGFSGCTFAEFSTGYSMAKIVYKDAKHVVYEVKDEKERVEKEGFGEALR